MRAGVAAVSASWDADRVRRYREVEGIDDRWGTAVTVQRMVFGNTGERSGTGVAFTRDNATLDGLGATHPLELQLLFAELGDYLDEQGIHIERTLIGTFVTALNMAGASITLVRTDKEILELWDAPTKAPAWPNAIAREYTGMGTRESFGPTFTPDTSRTAESSFVGSWIADWAEKVLDQEPALTDLDRRAGDGDRRTGHAA